MKITIEPSDATELPFRSVMIDTRSNDESTPEAVEAALDAVIAYSHGRKNVIDAAQEWADVQREVDGN